MRALLGRCLREPLVHFLLLGAAIFGLNAWLEGPRSEDQVLIEVTADDIDRLGELWQRQGRRPPTKAELRGLVETHVREEILYREALKMGLDRDDGVVRRRLAQKMEFLTEDLASAANPSEQDLERFLEARAARYGEPARVSLRHVYFSRDLRGENTERDVRKVIASLMTQPEAADHAHELGDRFMLSYSYSQLSERELSRMFGRDFAESVLKLPVGRWEGPVASGYGLHAVRVDARIEARPRALEEVRERVLQDYLEARREETNRALYARLRERYRIVVDEEALGADPIAALVETSP